MKSSLSDLDSGCRKKRRIVKHPLDSSQLPSPPELKKGLSIKDFQQQQQQQQKEEQEQRQPQPQQPQNCKKPTLLKEKDNFSMLTSSNMVHDANCCMFKIILDSKGNTAALCYLPTRYRNIIEFYHIEIPVSYRQQGLGDLLLYYAFQWVKRLNLLVIPTCPFVLKYLETHYPDHKSGDWPCIVNTTAAAAAAATATSNYNGSIMSVNTTATPSSKSFATPITPPNTSPIASTHTAKPASIS
ncbi:hypothetical protein BDF20DRAFT_916805 [Mycotypha africana]|uniref:uncharacterized protein n=1 Tax=Mycotypha africana TaxID=64632 RepID=UPI0022FFE994|nr:uncharacterized protein BDF20DRAFT_916805 [Mycotypha africana]KAI8968255.1 hypothetical protein BDF20DRAFT_916805 [Mycotypha africana]